MGFQYDPLNLSDPLGLETILILYGRGWESPELAGEEGDQGKQFELAAQSLAVQLRDYAGQVNARRRAAGKSGADLIEVEGPVLVSDKVEFTEQVNRQRAAGPIVQLHIYSHSWSGGMNFGGTPGTEGGKLATYRNFAVPRVSSLRRDAFAEDAEVMIYGCNAATPNDALLQSKFGSSNTIAQSMSSHLRVKVVAFACSSHFVEDGESLRLAPDDPGAVRTFLPVKDQ
jgi:hypothetical protein